MNRDFRADNKVSNTLQEQNNKYMKINILKSIRTVLILFAIIFVINKSLIYLGIKTIDYVITPNLLYLFIFITFFLKLQSRKKQKISLKTNEPN